jgi:hypothetical protein
MIKVAMPPASAIHTTASKSFLFMGDLTRILTRQVLPDLAPASVTAVTFWTLYP